MSSKFSSFYVLLFLIGLAKCSKLNVARVLLPIFDNFSSNYTLQSTDESCFRWSSTREDIISIIPVDYDEFRDCSTKVIVTTLTKERTRALSDIFAEDVKTNQILRCVIIVDVIESLAITTTTREIILEEAPEAFEVRAYDNQGNEFSSLVGVPLDWIITPLGTNKDLSVLRFITFRDSPYETPETLLNLEDLNLRGHKVLLEGVKTGISKVTVKLPQKEYSEVKSNEIQLTVIANLIILPAEVYIMVGDVANFKVIHTSYGHIEEVNLAQSQYYIEVEDKKIAKSTKKYGEISGISEGVTHILLHDKNMNVNEPGLKLPSAIIHVVYPGYMLLSFLPHKNWVALVSEVHDVVAEVYTEDHRKLALGPDVFIQMQIGDAFHIQEKTVNGTWVTGWTQREGVAEVNAVFESIGKTKLNPPLTALSEIIIYPQIVLNPSEVILPWDPVFKPKYDLEITATGGDGKFMWSSSNHSVGAVTQYGKVHTHSYGYFEVAASMYRNHHNRNTAKIYILPPSKLEIIEYIMEAELGSIVFLHIALYAQLNKNTETEIPFSMCQDIQFKVKMTDPRFHFNKEVVGNNNIGLSCANLAITSPEVGTSKVTVSYQGEGGVLLQDSVTVTFFQPLTLLKPSGSIVLGVGTSINLIFTGGPKPHLGKTQNKRLITDETETVAANDVTNRYNIPIEEDFTVVSVLCTKLGNSEVTLATSNSPSLPNCKNEEAKITVDVICGKPRKIEMYPELKVTDAKSCPMDLSGDSVVVQSNQDIDLILKVKDDEGREFLNISSFKFIWNLDPPTLGKVEKPQSIIERSEFLGSVPYLNTTYQTVKPKIMTGKISVAAAITGYSKVILNANGITPEWPEFIDENDNLSGVIPINTAVTLYLVDDTIVTPEKLSIYNHPSNRHLLDVKQGSGFYQIAFSKSNTVNIKYLDKSRQLDITPVSEGDVIVKLIDLCLPSKPAVIFISVVSVHSMKVEMSDKVELGKCIPCVVKLFDEYDNILNIPNLDLIELNSNFESNIASIDRNLNKVTNPGEIHFILTGTYLGETKLVFSIGDSDYDGYVATTPVDLQVFPPLKIYPRNATIAIGSQMQYSSRGGPQPIPNLEYSIVNSDIAKITINGIMKGNAIGTTKVKAVAYGINSATDQKIIYTEDVVDVRVIKLNSIKISAPITRFQVGATVPFWATGLPDVLSPLVLATIEPPFEYSWGVADSDIASIHGVFEPKGIVYDHSDMLSIHLTALTPGTTTVYLNVTKNNKKGAIYSSSIDIEVLEKLTLTFPSRVDSKPILIAPFSKIQLKTNLDNNGFLSYRLLGDNPSTNTDVQRHSSTTSNQPVTVSSSGLLQSYNVLGIATLIISYSDNTGVKQSIMVPVEVKPIHYMILFMESIWKINSPRFISKLPVGVEMEMHATYFDNIGNEFTAATVDLQVVTSRFDLVQIKKGCDNSSFQILVKKPGVTGLKIWSDNIEKTADYLKLSSEQVILPVVEHVTSGDVICFSTPLVSNEKSFWATSDPSLITVDNDSGVALVHSDKPGQASIIHSLHTASPIHLKINPLHDISIETVNKTFINAPENVYKAHVVLLSANSKRKTNLIAGKHCEDTLLNFNIPSPFSCQLNFENESVKENIHDIFQTTELFDITEGKYYCKISATPEGSQKYSTMERTNIILTVMAPTIRPQTVTYVFQPAIYIPSKVLLEHSDFTGLLVLTGTNEFLKNVKATALEPQIIGVKKRSLDGTKLTFHVTLLDYHKKLEDNKDFMSIIVESKDTKQTVWVLVKLVNGKGFSRKCGIIGSSMLDYVHSHRQTIGIVTGTVVIILGSLYIYSFAQAKAERKTANMLKNVSGLHSCLDQSQALNRSTSPFNSTYVSNADQSCYCPRSPEIRRNRRYI